jgi:predicted RNA binding protein YcfA (HicA-like mRNA interferase family)
MTVREVVSLLRRSGATPLRVRGSHQTWALPDGTRQTVVINHLGDRADAGLVAQLRKRGVLPLKETRHA